MESSYGTWEEIEEFFFTEDSQPLQMKFWTVRNVSSLGTEENKKKNPLRGNSLVSGTV